LSRPLITAIGSFPPGGRTLEESLSYYVKLQLELGFDLITDGEARHDMISYLAGDIPGLGFTGSKPAIVGRITEPRRLGECLKVKDLTLVRDLLREKGSDKPIKIAVTGPVTLGFTCALVGSGPYSGPVDPALYDDLALSLGSLASFLQSSGAIVQIDEPGLSGGFMDPTKGVNHLRRMTSSLDPCRTVVHVCGRISRRLNEELLKLEGTNILSHAFASSPENLDVLDRKRLLEAGKSLGAGIVRVGTAKPESVDSPQEIAALLESIRSRIGEDLIRYVHPDCGLRNTNADAATALLTNLSRAMGTFAE
jgi:methionine synthase II (cobalamin-independent)